MSPPPLREEGLKHVAEAQCSPIAMGAQTGHIAYGSPSFVAGAAIGNAIGVQIKGDPRVAGRLHQKAGAVLGDLPRWRTISPATALSSFDLPSPDLHGDERGDRFHQIEFRHRS